MQGSHALRACEWTVRRPMYLHRRVLVRGGSVKTGAGLGDGGRAAAHERAQEIARALQVEAEKPAAPAKAAAEEEAEVRAQAEAQEQERAQARALQRLMRDRRAASAKQPAPAQIGAIHHRDEPRVSHLGDNISDRSYGHAIGHQLAGRPRN